MHVEIVKGNMAENANSRIRSVGFSTEYCFRDPKRTELQSTSSRKGDHNYATEFGKFNDT